MDQSVPTLPCFVYPTHAEADEAVRALGHAGFDMKKLSLVGKGYHREDTPVGFYSAGDRIRSWGGAGAFWGGIWGLLLAPAVFFVPGLGLLAMAGPVVTTLVAALEGAVIVGGVSALGAALMQVGATHDDVVKYESALKADNYVLMIHGTADDAARARAVLGKVDRALPV